MSFAGRAVTCEPHSHPSTAQIDCTFIFFKTKITKNQYKIFPIDSSSQLIKNLEQAHTQALALPFFIIIIHKIYTIKHSK